MNEVGKTTDGLMDHIRDDHGIAIGGEQDRKDLLEMGYFHGYKAYRFLRTSDKLFEIESFSEIKAIYEFDNKIKSILYPMMMDVETTLKNYTISVVVQNDSTDIETVFNTHLTKYKEFESQMGKYKEEVRRQLILKKTFYETISQRYYSSQVIQHYIHQNKSIPLWAVFELITFGDYGNFLLCLNTNKRLELERAIGVNDKIFDTDGSMLPRHVFILKELRNCIAHNKIVFDCRFRNVGIRKSLRSQLENKLDIENLKFDSIIDYFCLIVYYQKALNQNRNKLLNNIADLKELINVFHQSISQNDFDRIFGTDVKIKVNKLERFV